MDLRDLGLRLTASTDELHHERLREQWAEHPSTPIAEAPDRDRVCLGGEIQGVQVVPRAGSPSLEVSLHDGTGRVVAVFTGRRSIGGVIPGRLMVVEGLARREGRRLVMWNPEYTLLP
jgi:hypothetical protein